MSTATLIQPTISHSSLSAIEVEVLTYLRSVRYGQITVQIHDTRIVQIERTEKIRPDQRQG